MVLNYHIQLKRKIAFHVVCQPCPFMNWIESGHWTKSLT